MQNDLDKILQKPKSKIDIPEGRYQKFNLRENPFPAEPFVNKDSEDNRINGKIYEMEIRREEYCKFEKDLIKVSNSDTSHLRLCYLIDKSYIGRGNGKTAFLVNLQDRINEDYCLNLTNGENKCFAAYLKPEPGGRTKTFLQFTDLIFQSIITSKIIEKAVAGLILESLKATHTKFSISKNFKSIDEVIDKIYDSEWIKSNEINVSDIYMNLTSRKELRAFPNDFEIFNQSGNIFHTLPEEKDFIEYYLNIKKSSQKLDFVYTHLINLFISAGFNGAYILVDDFERIPDFQSARQKRDFALELRSILYDGLYLSSRLGFYIFVLALHAGVPRLLRDAWSEAGMENRAPIYAKISSKHIIPFDKLSLNHAKMLIKKYLDEYRIKKSKNDNDLLPFTESTIKYISELSELNASRILKLSYELLELAVDKRGVNLIDEKFVKSVADKFEFEDSPSKSIATMDTINLEKKASKKK